MEDFKDKIFLSVTGEQHVDMQSKFEAITRLNIEEAAVFWELHNREKRDHLYPLLLKSTLKRIPFLHIRDDITEDEIDFFKEKYRTKYFSIHEDHFMLLKNWEKNLRDLYLEMNYDDKIDKNVKVKRIGGFCIDLAHFKSAITRGTTEATYIISQKNNITFPCNHLGGYDENLKEDRHYVRDIKLFDYLTTLPKFVFGKVIALEVDNPIEDQIRFKDYIVGILNNYFSDQKTFSKF